MKKSELKRLNEISTELYRLYDITEWQDKRLVLGREDEIKVLSDVKNGIESELLDIVRKPYPEFVKIYLGQYEAAETYLKDEQFPFKLYMMPSENVKYISSIIKDPSSKQNRKSYLLNQVREYLNRPFDEHYRFVSASGNANLADKKFINIAQYVDAEIAKSMGLSSKSFYVYYQHRDFDLEGKMDALNYVERLIITYYLGLYGNVRMPANEVAKKLNISLTHVSKSLAYIFDALKLTKIGFENHIGLIKKEYEFSEFRQYSNKQYREIDLQTTVDYIYHNILGENELAILEGMSNSRRAEYITRNYILNPNNVAVKPVLKGQEKPIKNEEQPKPQSI